MEPQGLSTPQSHDKTCCSTESKLKHAEPVVYSASDVMCGSKGQGTHSGSENMLVRLVTMPELLKSGRFGHPTQTSHALCDNEELADTQCSL